MSEVLDTNPTRVIKKLRTVEYFGIRSHGGAGGVLIHHDGLPRDEAIACIEVLQAENARLLHTLTVIAEACEEWSADFIKPGVEVDPADKVIQSTAGTARSAVNLAQETEGAKDE